VAADERDDRFVDRPVALDEDAVALARACRAVAFAVSIASGAQGAEAPEGALY